MIKISRFHSQMHRRAVGIPEEIEAPAPSKTENFLEPSTDMIRINASTASVTPEDCFERGIQVFCIATSAAVKHSGVADTQHPPVEISPEKRPLDMKPIKGESTTITRQPMTCSS